MPYKQKLTQLNQKLQARDLQTERLFDAEAWTWPFAWYLILKQSPYLLWTAFSLGVQICELLILAKVYFIYFPPESLGVLRVISASTFLGVFSAFTIRVLEDSPQTFSLPNSKTNLIVDMAKVFFNVGLLISFSLALHVAFRTNLNFTAPSILRAVILAGVVALPFDCINTFLFYNLRNFSTPWKAENLRSFSGGSQLLALVFLFCNWPLVFLVTKTLPRLVTFSLLWKNCTKAPVWSVLSWSSKSEDRRQLRKLFLVNFLQPFSIFLAGEIPLFVLFSRLTKLDSNIGVTLFFVHKLVHVLALLSVKAFFNLATELKTRKTAQDLIGFERSQQKLVFAKVVYAGVTLLLVPIVLMKSELVFWLSPVGVRFSWSVWTLFAATLLVIVHSVWTSEALSFSREKFRVWQALVFLASSLCLSKVGSYWGRGASTSLSVGQLFVGLALADLVFLGILRIGLKYLYSPIFSKQDEPSARGTLSELVSEIAANWFKKTNQEQALLFLEFDKNISNEIWGSSNSRGLGTRKGHDEKLIQLGRNSGLFLLSGAEKSQILLKVEEYIHRFAGLMNKVQLEFITSADVAATLKKLFVGERVDLALFRSFCSKGYNIKGIPQYILSVHSELLTCLNQKGEAKGLQGLTVVEAKENWPVYKVSDKKKRRELYQYLRALHSSKDKVLPELTRSKSPRYCYHLNQGSEPRLVVRVDESLKNEAHLLRFLALRNNLVEMGLNLESLDKSSALVNTLEAA